MLLELVVTNLGVIPELSLVLGPGMTALTGETGAGKTLVVTAIELLVGGRADAAMVRPGSAEAHIEGRFVRGDGGEVVLARTVPAEGRSRAYVDGRLAPVSALAQVAPDLVDLHGQHSHQSLLAPSTQRGALDRFCGIDLAPLTAARRRLADAESALAAVGGDATERARQLDLLTFEVAELDRAGLADPDEETALEAEEDVLADATAHRQVAVEAYAALADDGSAVDAVGLALAKVAGRGPFADTEARLRSLAAEVAEVASDLRRTGESIEEDPIRLEQLRARRALLYRLRRRYQAATLADLLVAEAQVRARLDELRGYDRSAAELEASQALARADAATAAATVGQARRQGAPSLAAAVEGHLHQLALPRARVEVAVIGDDPGDDVRFLLAANPGELPLPLAKVASGGELSRTMLALRLAIGDSAPVAPSLRPGGTSLGGKTLVFDEVDAGIGGEAALAVGRALSVLGEGNQVLVVTHLPQVAAFAGAQVAVAKVEEGGRVVASARVLDVDDRVIEVSRMLSGQPESDAARGHAEELLSVAARQRSAPSGAAAPGSDRR
ncbi:MAG: DNA repair protein RecN [Acidimicrobiales bacterium]